MMTKRASLSTVTTQTSKERRSITVIAVDTAIGLRRGEAIIGKAWTSCMSRVSRYVSYPEKMSCDRLRSISID